MLTCILLVVLMAWPFALSAFCWYSYAQGRKSESLPTVRGISKVRLLLPVIFVGLAYANVGGATALWDILAVAIAVTDLLPSRFRRWGWKSRRKIA